MAIQSITAKIKDFIKARYKALLLAFCFFNIGWVVEMNISSTLGSLLLILTVCILVILAIHNNWFSINLQNILKKLGRANYKRIQYTLTALIVLIIIPIMSVIFWDELNDITTPSQAELPSKYVYWTTNPDIERVQYDYALLAEFGVRGSSTENIDISIELNDEYMYSEKWFTVPDKLDRPKPTPIKGNIIIGFTSEEVIKEPKSYIYTDPTKKIEHGNRHLYLYFEGNSSLAVIEATISGGKAEIIER